MRQLRRVSVQPLSALVVVGGAAVVVAAVVVFVAFVEVSVEV